MFDRTRAQLQPQIDAQEQVLAQARALREAAQAQVDAVRATVASTQAGLQNAQTALAQAQGAVATAQTNHDTAQAQLDDTTRRLDVLSATEPDNPLPNGKPNPAWRVWNTKMGQLETELDSRKAALDNAANVLAAAITARDAAAARVPPAQSAVAAAQAAVSAAQDRLTQAQTAIAQAQSDLARVLAVPDELDARAARILAEPLNAADLEQAGDAELSVALTRRHARHDLWTHRVHVVQDRGATLTAHDATADDLAALAGTIRSWPGTGTDPNLNAVATALEGIAQNSRANRPFGAGARTDDLDAVTATLTMQVQAITALLAAANGQSDAASATLQRSADALTAINKKAPRK
jgi:DNA repair exonuclease SbcCD ATPase subunit